MTSVNSKFNILARSWKLKKTQIIWQNRKYKSMCQIQDVLVFYEHIQIGLNQSLRNLLCFSSKCNDLIRACPWRKKILINDWESIIAHREESERCRALSSKICSKKQLRVWWWQQCNPRKTLQFYLQWSLQKVFPALDLHKIVTEWLLAPAQYIYAAWNTILTIWLNMKTKEFQSPSFQLFSELGKTWKYSISSRFLI